MDIEKSLRSIEERLQRLRERVEQSRETLEITSRSAHRLVAIEAEKARNVANEALAEIRHLTEELDRL